jgi:hypothetical protein
VLSGGSICSGASLPPTYLTAAHGDDCNDNDATAWKSWTLYADHDGDGYGAGAAQKLCATDQSPGGYASSSSDCNDNDKSVWQMLSYSNRDQDGDSYTVAASGAVCSGAALPASYTNFAKGNDCDDSNPAVWAGLTGYADKDGDGVGAGAAASFGTNGSYPAGFSASGSDCNDNDKTVWQMLSYSFADADQDGYTVPASGQLCVGATLPPQYATAANGNDCNDHDPSVWRWLVTYPDNDGDGVGWYLPRSIDCLGATLPAKRSIFGDDVDDTDPSRWLDDDGDNATLIALH